MLKEKYKDIHQPLVEACKKGQTKAQFELYKLYYKAMYNTSLRIVNDSQEAEDIMQEAFLSAFKNINSFKGEVTFGAWLKRIVVNRSLDALKKNKFDTDELNEGRTFVADESYDESEVDEKVKLIKATMRLLPENYRVLLTLHLIEGYDHNEISEITGMKYGAVRTAYSRARQRLEELVTEKTNEQWMN
jgi:RNA polymerase sigma-70 factor (ECF subfamily)